MKATDTFKTTIINHLEQVAAKDPLFAESFKKPNKNIDDCITYILNQVKASGCTGFADEEIYNMAIHYYDEDDIKPGAKINAQVVVNHTVELTEADKEAAKQKALDEVVSQEKERLVKKSTKKKTEANPTEQTSLF